MGLSRTEEEKPGGHAAGARGGGVVGELMTFVRLLKVEIMGP